MNNTITHGGKRNNSGRHPVADKKAQVYAMILASRVNKLGLNKIKEIMVKAVEEEFKKTA